MYALFSYKHWVLIGLWLGVILASIVGDLSTAFSWRTAVWIGSIIIAALLYCWRYFWRQFPQLNSLVFPDLNGEWLVTLKSNWPIQEQLLEAAKSKSIKFEPLNPKNHQLPELSTVNLKAHITQNWVRFHIRAWSDSGNVIDSSNSIVATPERLESDDHGFRLYYLYEQTTSATKVTDQDKHYGAAVLTIKGAPWNKMQGIYWTNRSWRQGIKSAGTISLDRAHSGEL